MKYSSFLLIASIWLFTILCISAASNPGAVVGPAKSPSGSKEYVEKFFTDLSTMTETSSEFVKLMSDGFKKHIEDLEDDKKQIQKTVTKGTEMVNNIQSILTFLKSSPIPLKKELQSELKTMESTASTELNKLKAVSIDTLINSAKTKFEQTYNTTKEKIKSLSNKVLPAFKKSAEGKQAELSNDELTTLQNELSEFMKTPIKDLFASEENEKAISDNFKKADDAFSRIEKVLIRAKQIEYYVKESQKDSSQSKTGSKTQRQTGHHKGTSGEADSSIRSSLTKCAFAIMFGMLFFAILNTNEN